MESLSRQLAQQALQTELNGRNTEDSGGARLWISDNAIDLFTVQISGPFSPSYAQQPSCGYMHHAHADLKLITSLKLDT